MSRRRQRTRRGVVRGTNARSPPPVAQATAAQGANTSRAVAWRVRAAPTPKAGIGQATAGRVANGLGVGGACLARVQEPFVTVDFIIGEVFDYLFGRSSGDHIGSRPGRALVFSNVCSPGFGIFLHRRH